MEEPGQPLVHDQLVQELGEIQACLYMMRHDARADEPMIYVSPMAEQVLGLDRHAFMHSREERARRIYPDDRGRWEEQAQLAERTGIWDEEYRIVDTHGRMRWVRDRAFLIPAEDERPAMWIGWVLDITAAREARSALLVSEARYRSLVEQIPAVVFTLTSEVPPKLLYQSPQVEQMFGYPVADWLEDPDFWPRVAHPEDRERVSASWAASVESGTPFREEYRLLHADGHVVWVREQSAPVLDAEGRTLFWQGISLDTTTQRQAEEELRDSQERYRALVEQLPVVVYHYAQSGASIYVSPNVEDLLGLPAPAFAADHTLWHRLLHQDDIERMQEAWHEAERNGTGYEVECRYVREDGSIVWVRDTARVIPGAGDDDPTWQGVLVDITAQKLAEQERTAANRRYRVLVEQVPAIVYEMDPDDERRTLFVGPQVEELLGYTRQEWLDQPDIWVELLHPEDRETELAAHDEHNATGEPWNREYRLIASDGNEIWVRDRAKLVRNPATGEATWLGIMLDITESKELEERLQLVNDELELRVLARTTELADANELMELEIGERRRAELELLEAQDRYRTLVEHLPAAVYELESNLPDDHDPGDHALHDGLTYISPGITAIVGFTPAEWREPGFWKTRLHPHDRDRVLTSSGHAERTGEPFIEEHRYLAKDGSVVWVLDQATLRTRRPDGRPHLFQGVMLDITERKEAEHKADEAERRYRMLAEDGPFMTYLYELDRSVDPPSMRMEYMSPQAAKVIGYPIETWIDDPMRWFGSIHPDDRERVVSETARSWRSGEPLGLDYRVIVGDGRILWLRAYDRPIRSDETGRPVRFMGTLVDVTQEKDSERILRADVERYRETVEGIPGMMWTTETDLETGVERYTFIGPQSIEILGYRPEELMAELYHFRRLVHPDDRARVMAANARSEETGVWDEEFRIVARDGTVRHVRSMGRPVPSGPDGTVRWQGVTILTGGSAEPAGRDETSLSSEA
jgi:PAS domain S-box-containing protein